MSEGYQLKLGSGGKERKLLLKFMCLTYGELFPEQSNFSHLAGTVEKYFSFETPLWWVINNEDKNSEPVGCLWLGKAIDQISGSQTTHVFLLYVKPEHRRCGIGTALMEQAQKWAKESGDRIISLMVYCTNEKAINLYKSLGYQNQSMLMFKEIM